MTTLEIFKENIVSDVTSLNEFLDKYYKHDRFRGRGKEYENAIIESCKKELQEDGIVIISKHESITGTVVAFQKGEK